MEASVEGKGSPRARADAAVLHLVLGRTSAIGELQRAAEALPNDASVISDLAAAQLLAFRSSGRVSDVLAALESTDRALSLPDAPLPEALFNRALAAEYLYLDDQARQTWARFLTVDPDSPWADEARAHLAWLARPTEEESWPQVQQRLEHAVTARDRDSVGSIISQHPQRTRLWVEEEVLPAWGRAWRSREVRIAAAKLAIARAIGQTLAAAGGGDRMVAESVATIDGSSGNPRRLAMLASGHQSYATGLALFRTARDREARTAFEEAAQQLVAAGSPYAGWARFRAAQQTFYAGGNREVARALDTLLADIHGRQYPALVGRSLMVRGMAQHRQAEMADALRSYRLALAALAPTGELEHLAAAHMMIAENLGYQGAVDEAWAHRAKALSLSHRLGSSIYYYNTVREGAEDLLRRRRPLVALALQNEMVAWDRRRGDPLPTVETLLARSRTRLRLGDERGVRSDLERAAGFLRLVPEGERRFRLATDLELVRADTNLASSGSERSLSAAIDWAISRKDRFRLPGLFARRADARLLAGNRHGAISDLAAGIAEGERQRLAVADEPLRSSWLDELAGLYEDMVRAQMEDGRADLAFTFADRLRAAPTAVEAMPEPIVSRLASAMPADTVLIEYAVLSDRTLAWVVRRGGYHVVVLPAGRAALDSLLDRLRRRAGVRGRTGATAALAELSQALTRPLHLTLDAGERLVIVPDEAVAMVPFAALAFANDGRPVIRTNAVSYALSASGHVSELPRPLRLGRLEDERVLVIANPALDPVAFPELGPLARAADEAAAIVKLYPHAESLSGAAATRSAFLDRAGRSEVIHLAAHALPNADYPMLASLPMASTGNQGRAVYAYEIAHLDLRRTRLVVLAACSTAVGRVSAGSGPSSLAHSFLRAGASGVLATLWDVEDAAAQRLFVGFHRHLREGLDADAALRLAQLDLLDSGQSELTDPRVWGAVQLIGGATRH